LSTQLPQNGHVRRFGQKADRELYNLFWDWYKWKHGVKRKKVQSGWENVSEISIQLWLYWYDWPICSNLCNRFI